MKPVSCPSDSARPRSLRAWVRATVWIRPWGGNPPGLILFLLGLLTAVVMAFPVVYVGAQSLFAGTDRWMRLLDGRITGLLWSTLSMAGAVTVSSVLIGVTGAWLVHRCDLPGRRIWTWLLAMPLIIPPYVGAVTYISLAGPRGWIRDLLGAVPWNIYSFGGVWFVLTLFTYPYVFLVAGSAMKKMNRNYEDAARSLGLSGWEVIRKVSLPFLRPSIGAGGILIALYVLSDFGAVTILRYNTFTSAIYYQMAGYDNVSATVLSLTLIVLTLGILGLEASTRKRRKVYQTGNSFRPAERYTLGRWRVPALAFVGTLFGLSVVIPVGTLLTWMGHALAQGVFDSRFWGYAWNSVRVSGLAALLAMGLALPVVYLKSRHPSAWSRSFDRLSYAGYVLPGVIVALGLIFVFNRYVPWLYNTFYLVAVAYVIRFLPLAMGSQESTLGLISPRIDEAARSLGLPSWKVMLQVILPLIRPGILAGGAMVFVSSMKELPATLLLRPPGFDTLSVRVWVETSEALYAMAAPSALTIVLVSVIPLRWMLSRY